MALESREEEGELPSRSARATPDGWPWIAALARRAPEATTPADEQASPSDTLIEGLIAQLARPRASLRRRDERLVLVAAGFALAAALLLAAWSWPELSIALRDLPPPVDTLVRVEPWL